jgi:hypothetical protein
VNLSCYLFINPKHILVTIKGSTLKDAEVLQKLIKDIPVKKIFGYSKAQASASSSGLIDGIFETS